MPLATDAEQELIDKAHEAIQEMSSDYLLDALEKSMHPTLTLLIKLLNSTYDEAPQALQVLYDSIHEDIMTMIKEEYEKGDL